jgi:N-methylhydantoinase A
LKKIWIGIDTGGTFTDLALCELTTGKYVYHKLPTTTGDPARAVLDGIAEILELAEVPRDQVKFLVLGTTLATNAVLEGKCARTGLITTEGFRDILELARQRRPHYYNLDVLKPTPPALRDCRIEVGGRIGHDGSEVTPLAEDQVRDAVARLREQGVEAVAICIRTPIPHTKAGRATLSPNCGPRRTCARRPTCCPSFASSSASRRRRSMRA